MEDNVIKNSFMENIFHKTFYLVQNNAFKVVINRKN